MYGLATGALAPHLNLSIDEGTGGAAGSCTGFASSAAVYNGTVAGLSGSHFNFGTGAGQWSPQPAAVKTYRFTVTVQNAPAAQGETANATFVWEAQTGTPAPPVVGAVADNFADATVLTFPAPGTPTVADFNLTGATFEQWEPDNAIMWTGEPDTGSVWYQFTAPANMYVGVNTFPGADLPTAACNTILQILEGPVDQQAPNVIAENVDAEPTGDQNQTCATQSEVYFPVTSGTTYYINVQGWAAVDMTSGRLRLFQAAPPTYDNLADAIELGPVSVGSHDTLYHRTSLTTTATDARTSRRAYHLGQVHPRSKPAHDPGSGFCSRVGVRRWSRHDQLEPARRLCTRSRTSRRGRAGSRTHRRPDLLLPDHGTTRHRQGQALLHGHRAKLTRPPPQRAKSTPGGQSPRPFRGTQPEVRVGQQRSHLTPSGRDADHHGWGSGAERRTADHQEDPIAPKDLNAHRP